MMFIFSIMHNTGSNQLGGPDERKALTNEGIYLFEAIFCSILEIICSLS